MQAKEIIVVMAKNPRIKIRVAILIAKVRINQTRETHVELVGTASALAIIREQTRT